MDKKSIRWSGKSGKALNWSMESVESVPLASCDSGELFTPDPEWGAILSDPSDRKRSRRKARRAAATKNHRRNELKAKYRMAEGGYKSGSSGAKQRRKRAYKTKSAKSASASRSRRNTKKRNKVDPYAHANSLETLLEIGLNKCRDFLDPKITVSEAQCVLNYRYKKAKKEEEEKYQKYS